MIAEDDKKYGQAFTAIWNFDCVAFGFTVNMMEHGNLQSIFASFGFNCSLQLDFA